MNEPVRHAVLDVLEFLIAMTREGVKPDTARSRLQAVRRRHPELMIDLLSEEEAYDRSIHYDALIRLAGEGTTSLSYCPEPALPWPLRGVHRWSDADLVRVNAKVLQVDEAIALLDFIWHNARLIERLLNTCLVQEELERAPIELSDAELQRAMDEFRIANKLFSADETHAWIERQGMTHERLERYVHNNALVARLRDRITADRVDEYFNRHRSDFDSASIARFELLDESRARALAGQIRTEGLDFFAAAELCYLEGIEHGVPSTSSLFGTVTRRDARATLLDALFDVEPGQVLGPIALDDRFALVRVIEITPARLDSRTRNTIKDFLFDEWLADRRRSAKIEWYWGNADKTG
jgi:putative peptide maturation system protein